MSTAKKITTIGILLLVISVMTGLGSLCAEELERAGNEGYIIIVSTGAKISLVEEEVSGDNEKTFACLQEVTFVADDEICIFVNETQYPLEGRSVIITGTAQGAFSTNSGSIVATREVTVSHMSLVVTAEGDVRAEVTEKETELPTETNEISLIWSNTESVYGEDIAQVEVRTQPETDIVIEIEGVPTEGSDAGRYFLKAKTESPDYVLANETAWYTITPKEVQVVWGGTFESEYGEAISADITVTAAGVEDIEIAMPEERDAGSYVLTATSGNSNYKLTNVTHTYTITPKEIAVIWEGEYESEYGETPEVIAKTTYPEVKITIIGIPNDESPEGAYLLTAINENKNYKLVNDTKVFEVKGSALAAAIEEISTELEEAREEIETIKNEASAGFTQGEGKIVAALVLLVIILVMIAATIIVAKKNKKDQEGERENKDMTDKIDKVGKDLQKMKSLIEQLRRERESGEETFSDKAPELSDEELKRMQGWQNLVGEAVKNIRQTLEDTENQVETVYDEANRHYTKEDIFGVIKEISQEIGKLTETIHPQPGDKYNPNTMLAGNKGDTVETTLKPGMKIGQVVLKKAAVKLQKKEERND